MTKERIYLFDTTLSARIARRCVSIEDMQKNKAVAIEL